MQRGIATVLALLFSWLLVLPVFASPADLSVPACCRKGGKHHCMVMHSAETSKSEPGVNSIIAKCPCCPHFNNASGVHLLRPMVAQAVYSGLVRHPAGTPQTEANHRVSHDRSRQKRGPPSLILS